MGWLGTNFLRFDERRPEQALEVGDTVVNINAAPATQTRDRRRGGNLLRDDLGVPVFVINSELEAIACYPVRQPDTDTFRHWEFRHQPHIGAGHARSSGQAEPRRRALCASPG